MCVSLGRESEKELARIDQGEKKKGWECTREIENRKGEGGVGLGIKQPRS